MVVVVAEAVAVQVGWCGGGGGGRKSGGGRCWGGGDDICGSCGGR